MAPLGAQAPEFSSVQFGRTRIEYSVRRSSRRGTVSIAVEPDASVIVTAPVGVAVERLDGVVRKKALWVVERVRAKRSIPSPLPPREFVRGESVMYLGRQYRLRVCPVAGGAGEVGLRGGWLEVAASRSQTAPERAQHVRAALMGWFREHAAERLPERVAVWSKRLRLPIPRVVLREQAKRWASCDRRGVLRVNWRIVQAPMRLVDYLVAHELVHLRHDDHGREFWRTLGLAMPDYQERRAALKAIGPLLAW